MSKSPIKGLDNEFFLQRAKELKEEVIKIRRIIHQNPEFGFQEQETAAYISTYLKKLGWETQEGVGGTGVVGLLRGGKADSDSLTIGVRADMDALPIQEETGTEYASKIPGRMHACGHDAHVAMGLGLATVLSEVKEEIKGNVKLIFQPCEEKPPGGALEMIKDGVLEAPKVQALLGLHVSPYLPSGFIGFKHGPMMAATDTFEILLKGKGGHGAAPHQTIDTVVLGAQAIQALQSIPSRRVDPLEPVVLTIGRVQAGVASNVIAGEMELAGTVRTLDTNLRQEIPKMIRQILEGIVATAGATFELKYELGYPVLVNNDQMVYFLKEVAKDLLGRGKALTVKNPSMGGEDFAYFAEAVPSCYCFLGVGFKDRENYPWHHPKFDLNEDSLPLGVAILAKAVIKYLEEGVA